MTRAAEREHKLLAPDDLEIPALDDLGVVVGPPVLLALDATYFDTADLRLARSGASLRWRDDEACWVVKLPRSESGSATVRDTFSFAGAPGLPAADALDLVTALVRRASVVPVAHVRTRRTTRLICGPAGDTLAEIDDDEVESDGIAGPVRFREIEVEMLSDTPAPALRDVVRRLRRAGAEPAGLLPKVVRSLGERARRPSDVVVHPLRRDALMLDVVSHAFADAVARLVRHDAGVRVGDDPEDVHQARVATRRLRSHLRTFESVLDPEWARALADDLRWLGATLGPVRDDDVLRDRLLAHATDLAPQDQPGLLELVAVVDAHRDEVRAQLLQVIRGPRYLELLDRLVDAADRPRTRASAMRPAHRRAQPAQRSFRRLRTAMEALGDRPEDAALHRARILAKRARYATEVLAPVFGRTARHYVTEVTQLQEVLGTHQDAVVAGQWLRARVPTATPAAAFVAGELTRIEHEAAERARRAVAGAWAAARDPRLRRWM